MELILTGTGTSQGVPVIGCDCEVCRSTHPKDKRLRSAALFRESDKEGLAIDCGPDFRAQMLQVGQKKLEDILLTHEHMDHVAGLDDVRAFNFTAGVTMRVWATPRVQNRLKSQFEYAFADSKYPGAPRIELCPLSNDALQIGDVKVLPIPVHHGSWPVHGFRIGDTAYITDVNGIDETSISLLKGLKTLVLGVLHRKPHHSHFHLEEGIRISKLIGASQTYFTHISHHMGLHDQVNAELPDEMQLAYDGLRIEVSI